MFLGRKADGTIDISFSLYDHVKICGLGTFQWRNVVNVTRDFFCFIIHCEPVQKKIKVLHVRKIKEIQGFRLKRSLLCEVMYS